MYTEKRPLKTVLILAANPKETPQLRLDQEVREIKNGLQQARKRDDFVLQYNLAVRPVDIRRSMLDLKPDIVHFCGHGAEQDGLAFENELGSIQLVGAEALAGFFELFANTVECVFLNACYSEKQAVAIAKHITYVIGMKRGIPDNTAIEFAVAFYDTLGAGETIEFAYKVACNAIQWTQLTKDLIPIFLTKRIYKTSWTHLYQIEYSGSVWIKIVPEPQNVRKTHHYKLTWGPWENTGQLQFDDRKSVTLVLSKGYDKEPVPLYFNVMPASYVTFGMDLLNGSDVVDINGINWVYK